MSYIPDTSEKFERTPYSNGEAVRNPYWMGNLKDEDARQIISYDFAIDRLDTMDFDNVDFYLGTETREERIALGKIRLLALEYPLINDIVAEFAKEIVREEKNESIISIIDHYEEDELQELMKKADEGYENVLIKWEKRINEHNND